MALVPETYDVGVAGVCHGLHHGVVGEGALLAELTINGCRLVPHVIDLHTQREGVHPVGHLAVGLGECLGDVGFCLLHTVEHAIDIQRAAVRTAHVDVQHVLRGIGGDGLHGGCVGHDEVAQLVIAGDGGLHGNLCALGQ